MTDETQQQPQQTERPKLTATRKSAAKPQKPAKKAKPAKPAAPEGEGNIPRAKAPKEREAAADDVPFTVRLRGRHAAWVRARAAAMGVTESQILEKIVREGYAADPNNKRGASTQDPTQIGAVAERNQG